jgi:hypothetical protein
MSDLLNLLEAVAGMFLVLTLWVSLQAFVRRRSGCKNPDKDVLDFMLNGCGGSCSNKGSCHTAQTGTGGAR